MAIISITFAIGAALAGAAGMLYAIAFPQVYFAMGIIPGLKAFVAAVLGGIGSIPGALVGALIMGQAEMLSAAYISTPMRDAIAFTHPDPRAARPPNRYLRRTAREKRHKCYVQENLTATTLIFFGGALLVFVVVQVADQPGAAERLSGTPSSASARVMAIVSLGLNLIYGFNGQFSLGQWGFYAIGAYTAADITYRWYNDQSASALAVVLLGRAAGRRWRSLYLRELLSQIRGLDALSAFTVYLVATLIAGSGSASYLGRLIDPVCCHC